MNWMRRTVLGRAFIGMLARVDSLEADLTALERRVTQLETKLHQAQQAVDTDKQPALTPRNTEGPDLSPLRNFKEAKAKDFHVSPERIRRSAAANPFVPTESVVPTEHPPTRDDIVAHRKLVSIFGGGK